MLAGDVARGVRDSSFVVVSAHFYPEITAELRRQYVTFRSQFVGQGVPLVTYAVGRHYQAWEEEFAEVRVVGGDSLFQKERLWTVAAKAAEARGFRRFLCLDADIVFEGPSWAQALRAAFDKYDVVYPFERVRHMYNDVTVDRCGALYFPLRLSPRIADSILADLHRACAAFRARAWPRPRAFGFGVAFNSHFLNSVGLYQKAIVGGGDSLLWTALTWIVAGRSVEQRSRRLREYLAEFGMPDDGALYRSILSWIESARARLTSVRVGYVKGVGATALPHGTIAQRRYRERFEILRDYAPEQDVLAEGDQGLVFAERAGRLKEEVARYLRERLEPCTTSPS